MFKNICIIVAVVMFMLAASANAGVMPKNVSKGFAQVPTPITSTEIDVDAESFGGFTEECPYGDAVLVNKKTGETVQVDCILYDRKREEFDTWTTNVRGDRMYQLWEEEEWSAFNMDGRLVPQPDGTMRAEALSMR